MSNLPADLAIQIIKRSAKGATGKELEKVLSAQELKSLAAQGKVVMYAKKWFLPETSPVHRVRNFMDALPEAKLVSISAVEKVLKVSRGQVEAILKQLTAEGKATRLKNGNASLFMKTTASAAPTTSTEVSEVEVSAWMDATSERMQRSNFPIAEMLAVASCGLQQLLPVLQRMCEDGSVIPARGDVSLAPPIYKAAALNIHDQPHYYVRRA
jgi:hypothetical protein